MTDEELENWILNLDGYADEMAGPADIKSAALEIRHLLSQAKAEERERCAKVAEAVAFDSESGPLPSYDDGYVDAGEAIARAIRRGE
jgi:hypothetical protein